jgi:hypothetical protein
MDKTLRSVKFQAKKKVKELATDVEGRDD